MDITRGENRHVGFGFGIHLCLGAALAWMESQLAIGAMVERMPELNLESTELVWGDNRISRGVNSLLIAFEIADLSSASTHRDRSHGFHSG